MDRSGRQKINKNIFELNNTMKKTGYNEHLQTTSSIKIKYTFFSSLHGAFTKVDHIAGYKTHLNKFKRIEFTQCLFSHDNGITLEIDNRKIGGKFPNTWRLSNTFLNNTEVKGKNQEKV